MAVLQDDVKRLGLVDDLKKLKITFNSSSKIQKCSSHLSLSSSLFFCVQDYIISYFINFHGSLKTKRRQLAIKDIIKDGEWIEEPDCVKIEAFTQFCNRFQHYVGISPSLDGVFDRSLSSIQSDFLERDFSDCVKIKVVTQFRNQFQHYVGISPSLDGVFDRSLSSIQSDFLERDFSWEEVKRTVWDYGGDRAPGPDGFSFKFFTTKCKKGLTVSKVDFEKAFDSLRWDYMDSILEKFRQGDSLSFFLFILAMEGLHAITSKAKDIGLIKGATFGRDNMNVSHLMYADDVIFLG
nr:hypothetical protein [Tanacetum cinerariifolium]